MKISPQNYKKEPGLISGPDVFGPTFLTLLWTTPETQTLIENVTMTTPRNIMIRIMLTIIHLVMLRILKVMKKIKCFTVMLCAYFYIASFTKYISSLNTSSSQ